MKLFSLVMFIILGLNLIVVPLPLEAASTCILVEIQLNSGCSGVREYRYPYSGYSPYDGPMVYSDNLDYPYAEPNILKDDWQYPYLNRYPSALSYPSYPPLEDSSYFNLKRIINEDSRYPSYLPSYQPPIYPMSYPYPVYSPPQYQCACVPIRSDYWAQQYQSVPYLPSMYPSPSWPSMPLPSYPTFPY